MLSCFFHFTNQCSSLVLLYLKKISVYFSYDILLLWFRCLYAIFLCVNTCTNVGSYVTLHWNFVRISNPWRTCCERRAFSLCKNQVWLAFPFYYFFQCGSLIFFSLHFWTWLVRVEDGSKEGPACQSSSSLTSGMTTSIFFFEKCLCFSSNLCPIKGIICIELS